MQSNIPTGLRLRRCAGADLSLKQDFIVMLDANDKIQLHDGSAKTPYLLVEGAALNAEATISALDDTEPVRVKSAVAHVIHTPVFLDFPTGKAKAGVSTVRLGFALEAKPVGEGDILIRPAVIV